MLPHVNTSFNVDQIDHMLIANDNTYMFNQRMKMYFVDSYFLSKDNVICNYGCNSLVQTILVNESMVKYTEKVVISMAIKKWSIF
jgi:hypothetical protein